MVNPEDCYLDLNGLRLHYLDWGNHKEQPVLLLHGFMAHAHVWDDFALSFKNIYPVIALKPMGPRRKSMVGGKGLNPI